MTGPTRTRRHRFPEVRITLDDLQKISHREVVRDPNQSPIPEADRHFVVAR
jgi:hypothetical protein